jgi:hypothetical protein
VALDRRYKRAHREYFDAIRAIGPAGERAIQRGGLQVFLHAEHRKVLLIVAPVSLSSASLGVPTPAACSRR